MTAQMHWPTCKDLDHEPKRTRVDPWRQQRIRLIRETYKSTATQEDTQSKSECFSPKSSDWSRLQFIPEPSTLSILWGGFWAWYPFLCFVNSNKNMFPNRLDWFKNVCYYVISKLCLNPTMERLKKHNASNRSKSAHPYQPYRER